MRTIDIHAHAVPRSLWRAAEAGREWYGYRHEPGEGLGAFVANGLKTNFSSPKVRFTPEPFHAVGTWYRDFAQTTDEEVHELLAGAADRAA